MSSLGLLFVSVCLASPAPKPAAAKPAAPPSSDAEKITRLQRYIEEDEKKLTRIKQELEEPDSEFHRAEAEFKEREAQKTRMTREADQLRKDGKKAEADAKEKELTAFKNRWQHSRERFDLAIEQRKTLQKLAATLPDKIAGERKALARLSGASPQPEPATKSENDTKPAAEASKPATPEKPGAATKTDAVIKESKKLKEAREAARLKAEAAQEARDKVKFVNEYLEGIKRQAELEQRLLETARKKAALARHAQTELEAEQKSRVAAKAAAGEIESGWEQIKAAAQRFEEASAEERDSSDRLAELQTQLARAQAKHIEVLQDADKSDKEANSARSQVETLENPLNPRNVLHWLLVHGGKMLAIIGSMFLLYTLVRTSSKRIVRVVAAGALRTGREGEDRAVTLVNVFRTVTSAFIFGGGTLMLLDEAGIPIVPLMGGAAVFGLAVAFGAQNLIKDYFTGFMILMEDQYAVNDIVKINNVGGKVERITLRMTVLRDSGGVAHFIPHGTIATVSNMSHGWSRANLEISIAYKEDADRVLDVLRELGAEICRDDQFGPLILEDAEILGIDALTESGVTLKMLLKTKATKQWDVKRELLRRIKNRFDQLGIEIPYPHRTVYHHHEGEAGARLAA